MIVTLSVLKFAVETDADRIVLDTIKLMDKVPRLYSIEAIIKVHHRAQPKHVHIIGVNNHVELPIHNASTSCKSSHAASKAASTAADTTISTGAFGIFIFIFRFFRYFNNCRLARDFGSVVLIIREECINFLLQRYFSISPSILFLLLTIFIILFLFEDFEVAQFSWFITNICGHLVLHFGERGVVLSERH